MERWESVGEWVVGDNADEAAIMRHKARAEAFLGSGRIVVSNVGGLLRDALVDRKKLRVRVEREAGRKSCVFCRWYNMSSHYCARCNRDCATYDTCPAWERAKREKEMPKEIRVCGKCRSYREGAKLSCVRFASHVTPLAEACPLWEEGEASKAPKITGRCSADELCWQAAMLAPGEYDVSIERVEPSCCEKWRGKRVYRQDEIAPMLLGCPLYVSKEMTHCPECGRRLGG
jgi:hypothetical protein